MLGSRGSASTRAFSSRAPRTRAVRAMAFPKLVTYVKGDPKANTLGDCPFCQRVLLTLETKGVPYDKAYVDFADKPQWLVDKFEGKVPVVQEGDFMMADSDKIVVWLEEKFPKPSMESTAPEAAGKIFPSFRGWLMASKEEEADKKAAFIAALDALESALAAVPGPFFGGAILNSTDAALAPKLYHALTALKHWKSFDIYTLPGNAYPAVKRYRLALAELPAWKNTDYGTEAIIKGWARHLSA